MRFLMTISIILFSFSLYAQNAAQDFEKISKVYNGMKKAHMKLTYEVYDNPTAMKPTETSKGEVKIDSNNMYSSMAEVEMIKNARYMLMVDHLNQILTVNKTKPGKVSKSGDLAFDFQDIIDYYDSVSYFEPTPGKKAYLLYMPEGEYRTIELHFDGSTYLVNKIVATYTYGFEGEEVEAHNAPVLKVVYDSIDLKPKFTESDFSESKYLKNQNGKLMPAQAYHQYSFYNHVN